MKPAIIRTKKAHAYVGGKPIFDELKAFVESAKQLKRLDVSYAKIRNFKNFIDFIEVVRDTNQSI